MKIFSTITSPVFSELVILIGANAVTDSPSGDPFFETLRMMNGVRPFKLVFLLVVPDQSREEARRKLEEALGSVTARGLLDFFDSPPTVRSGRNRVQGWDKEFKGWDKSID
jgi:hypothetical protein